MTERMKIYGCKKDFIYKHYADIKRMRRYMSASSVAAVFKNFITIWDIYNYEKITKNELKRK